MTDAEELGTAAGVAPVLDGARRPISVRLSATERTRLRLAAQAAGYSGSSRGVSTWLRDLGLAAARGPARKEAGGAAAQQVVYALLPPDRDALAEAANQLRLVGSNLNQLVLKLHLIAQGVLVEKVAADEVSAALQQIRALGAGIGQLVERGRRRRRTEGEG
jgi:hypothetical protein